MKLLLNISTSIYIFLLFNREFIPFIDLRLVALPIFAILIFLKFIQLIQKKEIYLFTTKKIFTLILLFIFIIILSNIKWYFNPYSPKEEILFNTIILYIYNFFAIFVFSLYWNKINIKLLSKTMAISGFILFLSLVLQYLGVDHLPFAGSVKGAVEEGFSPLGKRVGGYAQDQNYATFGMVIWIFTSSIFLKNKFLLYIIYFLASIGILLSFSKTIILGMFFIFSLFVAKKVKLLFPYILLLIILFISIGYYLFEFMTTLSTMSIRFHMWQVAFNSFLDNPLLGSGITSVRSNFLYNGGWYIQPHNSFLAILVDSGFVALILYLYIFRISLRINDKSYIFLLGLLIFFSMTYELFVFQYPYFVLGILPILILLNQNNKYITRIKI